MVRKMKAVVYDAPRQFQVRQVEVPEPVLSEELTTEEVPVALVPMPAGLPLVSLV